MRQCRDPPAVLCSPDARPHKALPYLPPHAYARRQQQQPGLTSTTTSIFIRRHSSVKSWEKLRQRTRRSDTEVAGTGSAAAFSISIQGSSLSNTGLFRAEVCSGQIPCPAYADSILEA